MRQLGEAWRDLSMEEKQQYEDIAARKQLGLKYIDSDADKPERESHSIVDINRRCGPWRLGTPLSPLAPELACQPAFSAQVQEEVQKWIGELKQTVKHEAGCIPEKVSYDNPCSMHLCRKFEHYGKVMQCVKSFGEIDIAKQMSMWLFLGEGSDYVSAVYMLAYRRDGTMAEMVMLKMGLAGSTRLWDLQGMVNFPWQLQLGVLDGIFDFYDSRKIFADLITEAWLYTCYMLQGWVVRLVLRWGCRGHISRSIDGCVCHYVIYTRAQSCHVVAAYNFATFLLSLCACMSRSREWAQMT